MSIKFTIAGNPISSKNSIRSGITKQGRNYTYTLKNIKDYRDSALKQLKEQMQYASVTTRYQPIPRCFEIISLESNVYPITDFCEVSFIFYCCDLRKRDLVNLIQLPCDLLQQAGIIENDYLIRSLDHSRIMPPDKDNPRTIIEIKILGDKNEN